jgi:hypothetical protein
MSCGTSMTAESSACPSCGTPRNQVAPPAADQPTTDQSTTPLPTGDDGPRYAAPLDQDGPAGPFDRPPTGGPAVPDDLPTYVVPDGNGAPPAGPYGPPPSYAAFPSAPPGLAGPGGPAGPEGPWSSGPPPAAGPPHRGGKGRLGALVVVAGMLATALVGTLVFRSVSQSGGAGSPEAAVQQLADAVAAEDPLAAIAALDPREVRTLGQFYKDAQTKSEKLGLTKEDKAFGGVDLRFEDLEYEVEELGDDVAKVTVTDGSLRYDVETEDFGPMVRDGAGDDKYDESGTVGQDELRYEIDGDRRDPFIMVVKRNGGWYVSPFFTLAEYIVDAGDLPEGDFDADMKGKADAESPEDAVRDLATAIEKVDAGEVLDVLASDADVLRAYRDSITQGFEESLEDCQDECNVELTIDELELDSAELGPDTSKVTITSASGTAAYDDEDGDRVESTFEYDGECVTATVDGETEEPECFDATSRRMGVDSVFLVAVKDDGRWAVSPVATLLEYGRVVLDAVDDNLMRRVAGTQSEVEDPEKVTFGESFEAELNDAGWATYAIDLEEGTEVMVEVDDSSLEDDGATGILFDEGGSQVGYQDIVTIEEDGTYRLLIIRDEYAAATVDVTVGEVPSEPIEVGVEVSGSIDGESDVADYTFEGKEGDVVDVTIDDEDLGLAVFDPDGDELMSDFDDAYELPTDGTYRVRVSGRFDTPSSDFTLLVAEPAPFTVDGEVPTGPLSGSVAYAFDTTSYDIEIRSDQKVTVTVTPDAVTDVTLSAYGARGDTEPVNAAGPAGVETFVIDGSVATSWSIEVFTEVEVPGTFTVSFASI